MNSRIQSPRMGRPYPHIYFYILFINKSIDLSRSLFRGKTSFNNELFSGVQDKIKNTNNKTKAFSNFYLNTTTKSSIKYFI